MTANQSVESQQRRNTTLKLRASASALHFWPWSIRNAAHGRTICRNSARSRGHDEASSISGNRGIGSIQWLDVEIDLAKTDGVQARQLDHAKTKASAARRRGSRAKLPNMSVRPAERRGNVSLSLHDDGAHKAGKRHSKSRWPSPA
jgi:hypothetical protein